MKSIFKSAMLSVLLLTISCSQESTTDLVLEDLSATSAKGGKKITRPIKNSIMTTDNEAGTGGNFTGVMSHLGKIHGTVVTESFLPNPDGTFTFTTAGDVIYAANGDELYTKTTLIFTFSSPLEATYTGGFDITGGTGRFEGATGRMDIANGHYVINEFYPNGNAKGISTHDAEGTITY